MRLLGSGHPTPPAIRLDDALVSLRPPVPQDWHEWAALRQASRAFLTPWEPAWPADTLTRDSFLRRLRRQAIEWHNDQGYAFLTFDAATGRMIGGIGLVNVRRGVAQMATLGYWVGAAYARRGYTGAAVRLVVGFAFRRLNLHRVEASCLPTNEASRALLLKLGFAHEGYARGYLKINGAWRDHLIFGLVRDDWAG